MAIILFLWYELTTLNFLFHTYIGFAGYNLQVTVQTNTLHTTSKAQWYCKDKNLVYCLRTPCYCCTGWYQSWLHTVIDVRSLNLSVWFTVRGVLSMQFLHVKSDIAKIHQDNLPCKDRTTFMWNIHPETKVPARMELCPCGFNLLLAGHQHPDNPTLFMFWLKPLNC